VLETIDKATYSERPSGSGPGKHACSSVVNNKLVPPTHRGCWVESGMGTCLDSSLEVSFFPQWPPCLSPGLLFLGRRDVVSAR
jgi:hypothetical protein